MPADLDPDPLSPRRQVAWHTPAAPALRAPRRPSSLFSGEASVAYCVAGFCTSAELKAVVGGEEVAEVAYTSELQV